MKILIAEDNEFSRNLLARALIASGYLVEGTGNGKDAFKLARLDPPDIIISDILMPEMDGYELCMKIKADKDLCHIPFIFYTATYNDPADEKLAMDIGASTFIHKPLEVNSFIDEIKRLLNNFSDTCLDTVPVPFMGDSQIENAHRRAVSKKLNQKVKELEEEKKRLSSREKQYRRIVEALRDDYFFYSIDSEGSYTYISPSIKNVLGYTQNEFKKNHNSYITKNADNVKAMHNKAKALKGAKQPPYRLEVFHKDGSIHQLEITEEPVKNKGGDLESVEGIAHDITQRLLAEMQLTEANRKLQHSQRMQAIGTLASGIAHDFNNILTPIIGYTEISQLGVKKDSVQWKNLQQVIEASHRAKSLIKQILTFTRHTGEDKNPVSLSSLVKETLKLLRSSIPANIEIKEAIDSNCQPVMANPTQIHHVIVNLCTNAYHAMQEKGGTLAVSLSEIDVSYKNRMINLNLKTGRYLRLEISDTGTGIESDKLEKIYEPYYSTKSKKDNAGLGLSVVHGIVSNHDGYISVYSELGKGTSFHIFLPAIAEDVTEERSLDDQDVPGGMERILLVDDDEIICQIAKEILDDLGYRVRVFKSSREAAERFKENPFDFDLIITDMAMPAMTGEELSKLAIELRPDIPIILCTGFSELIDKEKALAIGIKEYLLKPMSRRELATTVRKALS